MDDFDANYWLVFFSDQQARRPAVIRQLLSKRLSNSTIFWGMRYQLLDYINVCPSLNQQVFDQQIERLCQQRNLLRMEDGTVLLTPTGQKIKQQLLTGKTLKTPQFFAQYRVFDLVKLLRLLIQVASEASFENSRYYVAVNDFECQLIVKKWVKAHGLKSLAKNLSTALSSFLSTEDPVDAWIFCAQFAGHKTIPATNQQLIDQSKLTLTEINIVILDLTSRFSTYLLQSSPLGTLIQYFQAKNALYQKSRATLNLFLQGYSIDQITAQRQLKVSTVQEHLLNAAIFEENFPYGSFLSDQEKQYLAASLPKDIDQWKYSLLADQEEQQLTFFKFRLYAILRSKEQSGK